MGQRLQWALQQITQTLENQVREAEKQPRNPTKDNGLFQKTNILQ